MKNKICIVIAVTCALAFMPASLFGQESKSLNLRGGIGSHPDGHAVLFSVDYEHSFTDLFSLAPAISYHRFEYEDGSYYEENTFFSAGCEFRIYPGRSSQNGFWFGPSAALAIGDWEGRHDDGVFDASLVGFLPSINCGWKISTGGRISFDPSLAIGHINAHSWVDRDHQPQLDTIYAVLSVGISFKL
jgi:hypothetical protein